MMFFNVNDDLDDRNMIKIQHIYVPCLKVSKTARTSLTDLLKYTSVFAHFHYLDLPVIYIAFLKRLHHSRECTTFLLEHCCISPQPTSVFSKPNHPHLWTGDIHICCILLFIFLALPNTARNLTFVNGYFCIFLYFLLLLS